MSPDPTSPTRTPTLFAEDSHASPTHKLDSKKEKPTPDTSGQKCLDLSGNAGPLGLFEKTLLESPNWAWTKYSMTWKTKATPQGHLIFQLARQAHRTSVNASGSSRTPKARANQEDNSTSSTRPRMWPTPRVSDTEGGVVKNVEYQNESFSRKNKKCQRWGVKLKDAVNHVEMWPTTRVSSANGV